MIPTVLFRRDLYKIRVVWNLYGSNTILLNNDVSRFCAGQNCVVTMHISLTHFIFAT